MKKEKIYKMDIGGKLESKLVKEKKLMHIHAKNEKQRLLD